MVIKVELKTFYSLTDWCMGKNDLVYDLNKGTALSIKLKITVDPVIFGMIMGSHENKEYIITVTDEDQNYLWIFNVKREKKFETTVNIDVDYIGKKLVCTLYGYEYAGVSHIRPMIDDVLGEKKVVIEKPVSYESEKCILCLEKLKSDGVFLSECQHKFHTKCVKNSQDHLFSVIEQNPKCVMSGCSHNCDENEKATILSGFKCPLCRRIGVI